MGNSMKCSSKTHCTGVSENPGGMHNSYCFPPADLRATKIQGKKSAVSQLKKSLLGSFTVVY